MKARQSRLHRLFGYLLAFLALAALLRWGSGATATADDKPPLAPFNLNLPFVTGTPNWIRVGNIPTGVTIFYDVAVCGSYHLTGTNNGLYALKAGGSAWQPQTLGSSSSGIVSGVAFANSECNLAYVVSQSVGTWRGSRTGDSWSWTLINQGLSRPYVVLVRDNTLFVTGDFGIRWTSPLPTNNTAVWQQATDITTTTYSLSVGLKSPVVTYAAVWNRGVFEQSPTEATEWHEIGATTIPNRLVYDVAANTSATATLIAGTDKGLMRRQGSTWATTAGQFTNTNLTVLAVGQRFYAGQKGNGVLYSVDEGANWQQMNPNLPVNTDFSVRRLRLNWSKDKLYAATNAGVWQWPGQP
jgi:hypothetical protein